MAQKVRVRFAPSPTGPLHIGGVRTALFNYLFASKRKGDFILRIEDTDRVRRVRNAEKYIIESLKWLQIYPNEGIGKKGRVLNFYRQSSRHYKSYANYLIRKNVAYYAFDSSEELDLLRKQYESEGKIFQYDSTTRYSLKNSLVLSKKESDYLRKSGQPYVIRFKIPVHEKVIVTDIIRGKLVFDSFTLDDKVLFKSDGLPTYHLANVVDDHKMEITHVIRGEEWLPSLPLHILLYKAFGWEKKPRFAHLPLILKPGGQGKLSKRDGDKLGFPVFPLQWTDPVTGEVSGGYRESGYFPEAMINMLAFLGWNPGTEQELYTLEELAEAFSLDRVGKSGSRFDPEKARWYNQQYLKTKTDKEIAEICIPFLEKRGIRKDTDFITSIIGLVKERMVFPQDLWEQAFYFFLAPMDYDQQMQKKIWKEDTPAIILQVKDVLLSAADFTSVALEATVKHFVEVKGLGFGRVMAPLRLLIVGSGMGPHLFDILEIIGRDETDKRIETGLAKLC